MGLLSKSGTFIRFKIEGELPTDFMAFAEEKISKYSFRDIDDSLDEMSIGWVSCISMLDSNFSKAPFATGDYVTITLRVDQRKISAAALKKFTLKEEERIKEEKQLPRLSRDHRMEIKEMVKLRLLNKAVPVPATYDLVWSLADNTAYFFTTNGTAISILEEVFKECFGLYPMQQIPYVTAGHLLNPEETDHLASLQPATFN